jgi:hypothetical protein
MAKLAHKVAIAKAPKTLEFVLETLESVQKLVLFLHHHDSVDLINNGLKERGIETAVLTGRESPKEKDAAIQAFQDGTAMVFIGSINASGMGLTLTKASLAIFGEESFVPGAMDQCSDRICRIGQESDSILVQYVVLSGSIDCIKINKLLSKRKIITESMDSPLLDFTVPLSEPEAKKPRAIHQYTDSEKAAMTGLLRMLSGVCDGAHKKDEMGFNGCDSRFGKALAALPCLTDKQAGFARRMLKKYHTQINGDLFRVVYPDFEEIL